MPAGGNDACGGGSPISSPLSSSSPLPSSALLFQMTMQPADGGLGPARRRSGHPRRGSGRMPRRSGVHSGRFGAGWVGGSALTWGPFLVDSGQWGLLLSPTFTQGGSDGGLPSASSGSRLGASAVVSPVGPSVVVPVLHGVVRPPRGYVGGSARVGGPAVVC